jgi:L-seryl-tRNA(Ser) seleniumtransferase
MERHLQRLTNAESASVTSSLASAAMVCLAATAANREVVVSRGEVTSIDGSSRLPELFQLSGARLSETGTANLTRIEDYAAALSPQTAAIMHVGASGFAVVGTAARPPSDELVSLARRNSLPLIHCLTQASLFDLAPYGIGDVPSLIGSVQGGADLTIFSGGGFIGGPPCGIIIGRRSLIEKIENHPLMQVVRAEKLTLAALGATLRLYDEKEVAERTIPVLSLLATPIENIRQRAERLAPQITATGLASVEILAGTSFVAGHEVPGQSLPTVMLALSAMQQSANELANALRTGTPAVVARVDGNRVIVDLRSVMPREDLSLVNAFTSLACPTKTESSVSAASS